ncbi:MAG TPA: RagB/SusD family nutrient uptake outer membrane protein [Gemmatimonadaceae bacterium]|nr:RagB/SusD family nutrient uptake outer membrane protein [Gemmatimonadaceae bacterium]
MTFFAELSRSGWRGVRAGGAALALVVALPACDIDTEPLGTLTTESFFQTPEQAIQATNATYSALREWRVHVFSWLGLTEIASDDATKGSVPADAGFLLDLDNLNFDPGNLAFSDPWGGYYRAINLANVAIAGISGMNNLDAALKERLIGENKFLRAYYYFFLVRAFGGVPLITAPLSPSEFIQGRATREDVYAQIEADLTDAIAGLPVSYAGADLGRATRGAAGALLAEVHLYQGEFDQAFEQAETVINSGEYSLFPDYATLFTGAGENSSESVFEVQAIALEGGNNGPSGAASQYAEVQGVRGTPNLGWGFNTPSPELEDSYEPGDPRMQATILYPWEQLPDGSGMVVYLNPSMPNNRYNQKVFVPPGNPGGSGNAGVNIRRIRFAHVLLTGAEAAARTNRTAQAQTWLNMVRARARGNREITLGPTWEAMAPSVAQDALGLPAGTSRVFVRFVDPDDPAYAAGLRSFSSECVAPCPSTSPPPVRVLNADIITSVSGVPVTTLGQFFAELDSKAPGTAVALGVLRVTGAGGTSTATPLVVTVTAQALLPAITSTGQDLLTAIWEERRHELAMEQHRWFDIIRQGRAAQLMAIAGKTFVTGKHELYPIPAREVAAAGLTQNPGY